MEKEALKIRMTELAPDATMEDGGEFLTFQIPADAFYALCLQLKNDPALGFDYLFCLTCVDWKTHLTTVYHLSSKTHRHELVLKVKLDNKKPQVHTVSDIWKTANFLEREVYEMFGVDFLEHPDQRLLILPDGWEGKNPLRKDFDDPVNMIKL